MKKRSLSVILSMIIALSAVLSGVIPSYADGLTELSDTTPSGIPLSQMESEIDQYVSKYIGSTVPGAAIAVVKDGEIIFSKGYGYSDVDNKVPVDSKNSIFEWGSITKIFTWTSAMKLAEEGRLDLDEDIRTYLPDEFLTKWNYEKPITMRNLMNHTAGFGDYGFDLIYDSPEKVGSLEEDLLKSHPAQYYEVGSASSYSNYGTALAGYIIENITGMKYDEYLKLNFYSVLNMNSTTADRRFDVPNEMKDRKSKGYTPIGETGYTETIWSYVGLAPAGSLNGTVEDLAQFAIALTPKEGEVTPIFKNRETLDTMFTPTYFMTANGFFQFDGEYKSFGHGGNTAGFTGQFAVVPEERFGVVILTNVQGELNIGYGVQEMLIGKKEYAVKSDKKDLPDSKEVEGKYISYRRFEGSFLEAMSYMSPLSVEKIGDNEIKLSLSGLEVKYVQTEPYAYKITGSDVPLFNMAFPILKFQMENGEVSQITVGHGFDFSPATASKSQVSQYGSVLIIILSVLLLVVGIIVNVVIAIKGRKKGLDKSVRIMRRIQWGNLMLLLATIVNNTICFVSVIVDRFKTFDSLKPIIITNYITLSLFAVLCAYAIVKWNRSVASKKYKLLVVCSMLTLASLFGVLINWNFFVIY